MQQKSLTISVIRAGYLRAVTNLSSAAVQDTFVPGIIRVRGGSVVSKIAFSADFLVIFDQFELFFMLSELF